MHPDIGNAAVVYHVRSLNPGAHLFEVTCRIDKPDPEGQVFSMPAWIPGSYLIRDYARHVIAVNAKSDGRAVPLRKIDKSTWRGAAGSGPLLLCAEIYANDLSARGAFLDAAHAFFNGVCLFFRVDGLTDERCVVHLAPPENLPGSAWKVATGLARLTGADDEFGAFMAMSYEELIDHPVLMGDLSLGRFEIGDVEHGIAITGHRDADMARLERDLRRVCTAHADLFGGGVPMNCYVFLITALNEGYGGLEHRNSSALRCSRDNLPRPGKEEITPGYREFLGLVSHEYFHLWNIKRIRPAEFIPHALDREAYTRQLWVFEGITSYYGDLGLLRSDLITLESYLELLGRTLTAVYRSPGRRRQTLEEASFDAWIKFYKQDENSPNTTVSYYSKGAMVALALDLELRLKSGGQYCLDDVMRAIWRRYGQDASRGLPEGGFESVAEQISGLNLGEFFKQSLRSTVDPPVGILLAQFGIRLHMRAMESETDRGGTPGRREGRARPWLGFRTRTQGGRVLIRHVPADSPATSAGLAPNDELVALNRTRVTASHLDSMLGQIEIDQTVELEVFHRDELIRVTTQAVAPPRDTCFLSMDGDADEAAIQRRREWLGG